MLNSESRRLKMKMIELFVLVLNCDLNENIKTPSLEQA